MIPVLVRKEMLTAAKVIARRNCSLNDRGDSDRYSSCRFLGNPPKTCGRCTVKLIKVSHFVYHFEGLLLYIYIHVIHIISNSHYTMTITTSLFFLGSGMLVPKQLG